jgi:tRNA(adenine34) deaminase
MSDAFYMAEALRAAAEAAQRAEVPIGCVIVMDGEIIACKSNRVEELATPLAHAELLAITAAVKVVGYKHLLNCTLYVTLEPCPMCAGAIVNARIPRVVFAAHDPKAGACETLYTLLKDERLNHRAEVVSGVCSDQASKLLKNFFTELRTQKVKGEQS